MFFRSQHVISKLLKLNDINLLRTAFLILIFSLYAVEVISDQVI